MKTTSQFTTLAALLLSSGTAFAQATVRWDDLPAAVNRAIKADHDAEFVMVTNAGDQQRTRWPTFRPTGVQFADNSFVPREEVAEIHVRHRGRLFFFPEAELFVALISIQVEACCDALALPVLAAGTVGALVASIPMLPVEAIRRGVSTKVLYRAAP
jgi:hypothetical protein